MKRLVIVVLLMVGAAALPPTGHGEAAQGQGDGVPGRYIVALRDGVDAARFARGHGHTPDVVYEHALSGFAGALSRGEVARLRANPDVLSVEPDSVMTAFDLPTGVNRIDADEHGTADIDGDGSELNIDIAIIDTGIAAHSKLRIAGGADFSRSAFLCRSSSYADGHGHGSHVAGTAAARDTAGPYNPTRVVGVAPGARLWAVKVLSDSGSGYTSCIIKGVDWVTARAPLSVGGGEKIEVANMSLGGGNSPSLCSAIKKSADKGVTYAVAAGNSDTNAANTSPANCSATSTGVLTTAAVADYNGLGGGGAGTTCKNYGPDDSFASFSNFGSVVNIAAPGVCILSTYKGGGYATFNGTSMASPHVAGAAAIYRIDNPAANPQQVRDGLIAAARPSTDSGCGYATDATDTASERSLQQVPILYVGTSGTCGP